MVEKRRLHSRRGQANETSKSTNLQANGISMSLLISALITFVVVILILYLVNMLPIEGRVKQIIQIVVIIVGILSLVRYITL
jgi:hypothetical protein